jgi:hypothetical protein
LASQSFADARATRAAGAPARFNHILRELAMKRA